MMATTTQAHRIGDQITDAEGVELTVDEVWPHGFSAVSKSGEHRWFPAS